MTKAKQDHGPCRHQCRHYDCIMDRREALPEHVTAYQDGVAYQASRTAVDRDHAARAVAEDASEADEGEATDVAIGPDNERSGS